MSEPTPALWRTILTSVAAGELPIEAALESLGVARSEELHLDHDRTERCGVPEVVYGAGKSADQIDAALRGILARSDRALATRVAPEIGAILGSMIPRAHWHERARCLSISPEGAASIGRIAVVCAGTSDLPVAEEARVTAETLGSAVEWFVDVGVAGLHRLLGARDRIRAAHVVVVVAGMEGALPSVVGGMVSVPVIAVPTSVGYGASFGGLAALLGMLNSCAPGVSVVNIDNGFGAGVLADRINRLAEGAR